jgi:hypothetical protein
VLWVVAAWSIVKQRRLLRTELQGLVDDSLYNSVYGPLRRVAAQWNTLRRKGFRSWLQLRRLQSLCIKLAHTQLQARVSPENPKRQEEANVLQAEIGRLFHSMKS